MAESILYSISHKRVKRQVEKIAKKSKRNRGVDYAQWQYEKYLRRGISFDIQNKVILELGCGHGGISCFLALNGGKQVYGLDINEYNLRIASEFRKNIGSRLGVKDIPVQFINQNAHHLDFTDDFFDLIIADNVFEHFDDNISVLKECKRVLKPKGKIIVPSFPSIYSKEGAHLKKGIAVPWVYALFREKTIVKVLQKNSQAYPVLHEVYGGLADRPDSIKGVRKYKDLNYITNKKFKKQVQSAGLTLEHFDVVYVNLLAKLFSMLFINKFSIAHDLLSLRSTAILRK